MDRLFTLFRRHYGRNHQYVRPLTGSASNRQYFRLGDDQSSCIGVIGVNPDENRAFIAMAAHFRLKGIPVPEVYAASDDAVAYIQEDVGDVALFGMIGSEASEEILCRTIRCLPDIQFKGAEDFDFSICHPIRRFDRRLVLFDLNYFKYCFLKPSGLEFDENRLQDDFERLADDLTAVGADTFMYRDFQVRNVMVKDGNPCFIDFQGGMQGPIYYDVASFIWHARAGYSQELKMKMLDAYLDALSAYVSIGREEFIDTLRLFVLFRTMQVLGAYGFRGLVEQKAAFVVNIPEALASLDSQLEMPFESYPYLDSVLRRLAALPRFARSQQDGKLEVKVYSFSFKKGIPQDLSGNGGGYVFDCRSIHNPGRYEPYKKLTGRDKPVIDFLEEDGEITGFLEHVYGVVDPHVETFSSRGFTSLMVSFGCTGGQHRSVYCAEHLAHHLADKYPHVRVRLIHREQKIEEIL
ncbi:MAG: phosphotransferase [Bacteroidales bacterium]|nr:phosphotransferase [Bacteroidales bacterium]